MKFIFILKKYGRENTLGTPAEMHGFVYETFVWQIVKYGGQVNE